ncbi:MAG: hypothetical protein LLG02_06360 [Pelosinus sp.]|nr:hypothetical protein [Pelosinus sp.]
MKRYVGIFMLLLVLCLTPLSIGAEEPLVNINVVDANVRDILTSLADIGQVNLVADDSVMGKITVQITDTPFSSALDIVTRIKGLTYQKVGNVIIVGSNTSMGVNFGTVTVFKIKYAQAAEVVDTLGVVVKEGKEEKKSVTKATGDKPAGSSEGTQKAEVKLSRLKVDEATNSILFNGSPSEVAQIQKLLDQIDVPYEQVSLECQVLSVNKTDAKNLGIEWSWSEGPQMPKYDWDKDKGWTVTRNTDQITSGGTAVNGVVQFGNLQGHPYEWYYKAKLNALITNDRANVLAKPKITTINGKEAEINIGDQIPVKKTTTTSNGVTDSSVEYKDVGIKLKYTPRINPDGYITAKIRAEVNSVASFNSTIGAYTFSQKSAETQVRLKDGETMVIGGLIGKTEQRNFKKVPLLGDIPILGALFKNQDNSKEEQEVVIFLTAHIVK